MKKAGLIITIGTRDLQLNAEIEGLDSRKYDDLPFRYLSAPREIGKFLPDPKATSSILNKLECPIIRPIFEYIRSEKFKLHWIVFVSTDQKDAPEKFTRNDTLHYVVFLKSLIRRDFSDILADVDEVFEQLNVEKNVVYLDSMYNYFKKYFTENEIKKYHGQTDKVFYCSQGGIDALNTGLLLNLIEYYPNLVQLQKTADSDFAIPLKFIGTFEGDLRKKRYREKIKNALDQYNYSFICEIAENKSTEQLCARYALARYQLDFNSAREHLKKLLTNDPDNRGLYMSWDSEISPTGSEIDVQKELFMSAMIHFNQNAIPDYLWRIFTIAENILKPSLEKNLNGVIEFNARNNHASWNELINRNAELKKYLDGLRIGQSYMPLNFSTPNRIVFEHVYNYFYPEGHPERPKDFTLLLECIGLLSSLRNSIAHSMQGISLDDINNRLKDKNLKLIDFNRMLGTFFHLPDNSLPAYDAVNNHLKGLLAI